MTDNLPENKKPKAVTKYPIGRTAIDFTDISQITSFAEAYAKSDAAQPIYRGNPANAVVAILYGRELGFEPMTSLQNIFIVNNRPCMYAEAMHALVKASPVCEYMHSEVFGNPKDETIGVRVTSKRKGVKKKDVSEFTAFDAIKAGLWNGQTWKKYPVRMLTARAISFHVRDNFPDVTKGIKTVEEVQDSDKTFDFVSEPTPEEQARILKEMDNDSIAPEILAENEEQMHVDKDQLSFLENNDV